MLREKKKKEKKEKTPKTQIIPEVNNYKKNEISMQIIASPGRYVLLPGTISGGVTNCDPPGLSLFAE